MLAVARLPMGCWTYLSLTQVTTLAASLDHQLSGMTRMFGIAASAAGAPDRMSDDCTQRAGIDRAREDCTWPNSGREDAVELTWMYGIPRNLNCCSTFVYATRALSKINRLQTPKQTDASRHSPAVGIQLPQDVGLQTEARWILLPTWTGSTDAIVPFPLLAYNSIQSQTAFDRHSITVYSSNIEPPNVLHDEVVVHGLLDLLDADEGIAEVLVGYHENKVVGREVAQLNVDLALGILSELLDL